LTRAGEDVTRAGEGVTRAGKGVTCAGCGRCGQATSTRRWRCTVSCRPRGASVSPFLGSFPLPPSLPSSLAVSNLPSVPPSFSRSACARPRSLLPRAQLLGAGCGLGAQGADLRLRDSDPKKLHGSTPQNTDGKGDGDGDGDGDGRAQPWGLWEKGIVWYLKEK